jgi:hypothetical protein
MGGDARISHLEQFEHLKEVHEGIVERKCGASPQPSLNPYFLNAAETAV